MTDEWAAVIVAGGRGSRMGPAVLGPKQYRMLDGKTVLRRSVEHFHGAYRIVVVIHADDAELCRASLTDLVPQPLVVIGGIDRQASVANGLAALDDAPPAIVLVHDAARPFVGDAIVARVVLAVRQTGAGIVPGVRIVDTLKRVDHEGQVIAGVDRDGLIAVQTPQGFPYRKLRDAHADASAAGMQGLTDDASIYGWAGHDVRFVEGSADNFKITTADDLVRASRLIEGETK